MDFSYYDERLGFMKSNSALGIKRSALSTQHSKILNERGLALVLVLWFFIFLFVVAINFASSVREEGMAAHRYAEETEGYYLALAGFEQTLYRLLENPEVGEESEGRSGDVASAEFSFQTEDISDIVDGKWREGTLGKGLYRVRLVGEGGKVNINRADEVTLRRIFTNLGIDDSHATVLVDSIIDWRDEDDLHRLNGAENDYYLSLSPSYTAKNGPFDAVEDLLWVRGVTHEHFYGQIYSGETGGSARQSGTVARRVGLREIFTVDNPRNQLNLRTASAEVIHAVVGLSIEKACEFIEQRDELSETTLADVLELMGITEVDTVRSQFGFFRPTFISIEAAGLQAGSLMKRQVRGVVQMRGNRGFRLVRWMDRDMGTSGKSCS